MSNPSNLSNLTPNKFSLTINRIDNVIYESQQVILPGLDLNQTITDTPLGKINHSGTKIEFGQFSITFKLDEDMNNYNQMLSWFFDMAEPGELTNRKRERSDLTSDGILSVYKNTNTPNFRIKFEDLIPQSISEISFDVTDTDAEFLTCDVVFNLRRFSIDKQSGV